MNDLISRQAAIEAFRDTVDLMPECYARDIIADLPSAQPEIVRCKDCKHRTSYWGNCRLLEEKYHQSVLVGGDSFCSMAERRTDEQTD